MKIRPVGAELLSTGYSCQVLMKLDYSLMIFKKFSNIKFHENPSSGSRVVKYPLFLSDVNETWFSLRIFKKFSNIKFRENPSSVSRVVKYPLFLSDDNET